MHNQEKKLLVSVIVPIYNVEQYLARCVDSIIKQTYENLEIILVNDGSTDDSLKICYEYKNKDTRIKVFDKKNGGLSDARNYGMRHATGQYLVFVDSDDSIHNQMVEFLYNSIICSQADISVCNFKKVYEDEISRDIKFDFEQERNFLQLYDNIKAIGELFNPDKYIIFTVAWNKMYKKEAFLDIEYPKGKIHEDEFTAYRLFYNAKKIVYLDKPLYYYLQRNNSIMNQGFSEKRFHKIEAYQERIDFFITNNLYVKEAAKGYFWNYLNYIQDLKKFCPDKKKEYRFHYKKLLEDCNKLKKYLSLKEYISVQFQIRLPKFYLKLKKIYNSF